MQHELAMSELLTDPLIRLLLKADGISLSDFSDVIDKAAARLKLPSHSSALKDHHTGPHALSWQEPSQTRCDATIEVHKPEFSSPAPAFA